MTDIQKQLERARKQWQVAKERFERTGKTGDRLVMELWEKMGKKAKAEIEARMRGEA